MAPGAYVPPAPDSLEGIFHATGKPYAFVDMRTLPDDHWLHHPLTGRLLQREQISTWADNFDGILYLETRSSSSRH